MTNDSKYCFKSSEAQIAHRYLRPTGLKSGGLTVRQAYLVSLDGNWPLHLRDTFF